VGGYGAETAFAMHVNARCTSVIKHPEDISQPWVAWVAYMATREGAIILYRPNPRDVCTMSRVNPKTTFYDVITLL